MRMLVVNIPSIQGQFKASLGSDENSKIRNSHYYYYYYFTTSEIFSVANILE